MALKIFTTCIHNLVMVWNWLQEIISNWYFTINHKTFVTSIDLYNKLKIYKKYNNLIHSGTTAPLPKNVPSNNEIVFLFFDSILMIWIIDSFAYFVLYYNNNSNNDIRQFCYLFWYWFHEINWNERMLIIKNILYLCKTMNSIHGNSSTKNWKPKMHCEKKFIFFSTINLTLTFDSCIPCNQTGNKTWHIKAIACPYIIRVCYSAYF